MLLLRPLDGGLESAFDAVKNVFSGVVFIALVAIPIVPDLMALDANACWLHHTEWATQNVGAWECAHRTWFRDRHWRSLCLDGMHDVAGIGGCSDPRETCVMRRSQIAGFCGVPLLSLLYGYNQTQSDVEHTHNMVSAPTACEPAAQNRPLPQSSTG